MTKVLDKVTIMNNARVKYQREHDIEIKQQAEISFDKYKNDPLFVAGLMLYWAEGKTTHTDAYNLELNNSDPKLLKLYYHFLYKYLNVTSSMLKIRLFLYPDLDENKVKLFWSELLDIPLNHFIKSYVRESYSFVTRSKLPYGTCSLYITRKDLRSTIET